MSENVRPHRGGGAADDVLAALSGRVRELQTKLASLQASLDEAQKRLATYEEFDSTLQDALSGALRAAYEIRSRAEETANQLLEQAREERRLLMKEVQRIREERDALQEEIATLRRGGIAPVPRPAPVEAPSAADLKAAAAEAMRSIFDEIVQEMRERVAPAASAPAPRTAVQAPPPLQTPVPPAAVAPPPTMQAPPAVQPARPAQPAPPATPPTQPAMTQPVEPVVKPAAQAAAAAPVAPRKAEDLSAALARQFEVTPAPPIQAAAPAAAPAERPAEPSGPSMEIQLVLSPVPSFPRLVEIERRIQALPGVRTLYVRDFRNGVATLAVGLRSAMSPEEFASAVQTLDAPRFHLESVARNSVELRVDSEAATA